MVNEKCTYCTIVFLFLQFVSCNSVDDNTRFKQVTNNLVVLLKKGEFTRIEKYIDENNIILEINALSDSLGYKNKGKSKTIFSYNTVNHNASQYFKDLHSEYRKYKKMKIISNYLENKKYHFFIYTKTENAPEITEIILKIVNDKVKIYDYKSFTTGLSFREDFIHIAFYNINKSSELNQAIRLLNKSTNLASRGDVEAALENYDKILEPYKYFKTFIQTKVNFVLRYGEELTEEQRFQVFDEWIDVNWENKGFRYYNLYDFYKNTEGDSISLMYRDSLENYIRKENALKGIVY
ncbi:hypothetical protein [Flavobacterium sp. HNIBRBA15423]|uniref:hypothetical protein n=1 Tax=Flavobacterium sp. HNIBRBA15423 TaxID=3458683 RepID=UPI0040442B5D